MLTTTTTILPYLIMQTKKTISNAVANLYFEILNVYQGLQYLKTFTIANVLNVYMVLIVFKDELDHSDLTLHKTVMYVLSILLQYVNQSFWSILVIFIGFLVYIWWSHPHKRFPPGVRGYPIVGALPYLGKSPEKIITDWSREKYGPIMSVRFGTKDIVHINSYDMLSKAFISNSSKYVDRPDILVMKDVFHGLGYEFRHADSKWKAQRNFAKSKLTRFGFSNADLEMRVNEIVDELLFLIKNKEGRPFNFRSELGWAQCNTFVDFCFGKNERDEEKIRRLMDNIFHLFSDITTAGAIHTIMMVPSLKVVPVFKKALNGFYKRISEILDFIDEEIAIRKKTFNEEDEITDFVSAFWKEMKTRDDSDGFSNEQLRVAMFELLFAGTESSALTLLWGMLCLLHYPDSQKKLAEEINLVIGKDERPSSHHMSSLPYTMAFLQELYRFRPVFPFSNQRMTNEMVQLGDYILPKNTAVVPNLWAIHNDPDLWEKPERFIPERHLDEEGNFVVSKKIIPFSIGGRSCPGEKLARFNDFIIFVNLVKKYEFLPNPEINELPVIDEAINGFEYAPFPFEVVAKPRE